MSDSISFYDQWRAQTPEDVRVEADPEWGECKHCHRSGHLYSLSPVGFPEVCNTCLTAALEISR